ncbi:MAG TPA: HDIG domain-containing protein [Deltaproteobacteria bacterium]|nr:HDIG domain-containing protein [Deltaproteobacteria bacterium]HQB38691.1 HDIG domain-containing protein [Deltaproteobacteria bacterium]
MPDQIGKNQEQTTQSYLSKLGFNLIDSIVKRFTNPQTARRNRFILFTLTSLLLTFIILPDQHFSRTVFKVGDIASSDIRAPHDYMVEDQALTDLRRKEAGTLSPVVYSLSDRVPVYIVDKLTSAIAASKKSPAKSTQQSPEQIRKQLTTILDTEVSLVEARAIQTIKDEKGFLADTGHKLHNLYQQNIVLDAKVFETDMRRGIEMQDNNGNVLGAVTPATRITAIADSRKAVSGWKLSGVAHLEDSRLITAIITRILMPNLFYNQEATAARSKMAIEAVKPVMYRVQKGEMIVRTGERISPDQARKLNTVFHRDHSDNRFFSTLGTAMMIMVLFYFPYRFACKNIRKFNPSNKDILILSLLMSGSFFILKIAMLISRNIGPVFPQIDPAILFYLFPFAAGPMIVRVIINSEVALVYCAVMAPLLGIMFNDNMSVLIYALLGGIVGAHGMRQCTDRSTIYFAGLKIALANLLLAVSFQAFNNTLFSFQTLYVALFAVLAGMLNAVLASGLIPVIEMLFNYTTDIKLLELANLNSSLLRELMMRAPGTYHHSVMVGNLVEGAAEAVNANPLLARVAAYYHDIGKLSKPLYFIENQTGDDNRHDKLAPSMSALILISHIKEGVELAREKQLGQPIIDIIRQHHGTGLIRFFYDRAQALAEASGSIVEETEFRYPGPKPQTREAGIVMLADCVEAASRTLANPTPDRIQGMVQTLINRIFIDGQLDECELTLKNLHEIAKSFNHTLNAFYHHRIDYPEPAHKGSNGIKKTSPKNRPPVSDQSKHSDGGKPSGDHAEQPPETLPGHARPAPKSGGEDIKRLGMS